MCRSKEKSVAVIRPTGPTACICWEMVSSMMASVEALVPFGGRSDEAALVGSYRLGKQLREGAFGVVYTCRKQGSRKEFAVKIVDQVEVSCAERTQEADLMRRLAHPCVAKLHDVYYEVHYEESFVCMVLELYKCDLGDGMQLHWKNKGMVPIPVVQNIVKMVVQSAAWLHENGVVHRDLKGENFLMDHMAIESRGCRIFLSDFGTATGLLPDHRLNQNCGTKSYWAPEFYNLNYGFPVDMWAIGVLTFALVSCGFPFENQHECNNKQIECPSQMTKEGVAFIDATLMRDEMERLTANQALGHIFLEPIQSAAEPELEKLRSERVSTFKEASPQAANPEL